MRSAILPTRGPGGLAGSIDEWQRFGRALLGELPLLSPASRKLILTTHLTPEQREIGALFLEGLGPGCGGLGPHRSAAGPVVRVPPATDCVIVRMRH